MQRIQVKILRRIKVKSHLSSHLEDSEGKNTFKKFAFKVFIAYLSILHKQQSEEGEQWNTLQQ
jgi:hypothetical protein